MAGAGFGSQDSDGTFGFKATADGKVSLGNTSDDLIQVTGSLDINGNIYAAEYIYHGGDTDTKIQFIDNQIKFTAGNVDFLRLTEDDSGQNEITFNQANADVDFIIESPSEAKAVYLNSGNEVLHINHGESAFKTKIHSTNGEAITVNNSGLIINEDGHATNDFRVESDSDTHILFVDSGNNKIGIGTDSPSVLLDVDGKLKADYYVTTPTATDLGSGTSATLTPSTSLHFLDADSVTLASGKDYFEITLADGATDGQHVQLAITTAANNPVRIVGDTGGEKAAGTIAFTGVPADGQGIGLSTNGSTSYTVTMSTSMDAGQFVMPNDATVMAGINGVGTAADMAWLTTEALNTGILAGWGFTTTTYSGGSTTAYVQQAAAGTSGNQTITENMDNATVTGFSGGTALVEGTINSTYGVALAGTSAAGGLLQGAHFVWDATSEQWQIIAGTQLTS